MQIAFGRVRRKTAPTGPGHSARKLFLKLTPMGVVPNCTIGVNLGFWEQRI